MLSTAYCDLRVDIHMSCGTRASAELLSPGAGRLFGRSPSTSAEWLPSRADLHASKPGGGGTRCIADLDDDDAAKLGGAVGGGGTLDDGDRLVERVTKVKV